MADFYFISYSSVDGKEFALRLADDLAAGPPALPVWLDKRRLRPGEDWDEQVVEAIRACRSMIFVMTADSVRADSVCKNEWVRALRYKKPIIPLLLEREAELPFRLGSREYINFTGSFDAALARLRNHLGWMDSPAGQLQALKHRLADAQRELPRAEAEQQVRIREDIAELEKQVAQQQAIVDNPKAAERQVQKRIEAGLQGERQPAKPATGIAQGRFVYPPPLIAPTWFQNRHLETAQLGDFLKDPSLRLMTIVGRGGVGKSAMVCRLLLSLQGGQLPDDGGPLAVDGIVYLSDARSFHRVNVPDLYAGLTRLLPEAVVQQLDALYMNPQTPTRAMMEALLQAFPGGRTVVLLDNFEDEVDPGTGHIKDAELTEAIRSILELPPHGLKVILTTRVPATTLALVEPARQRRLDLDKGLEYPYAENVLRAMDADGKVGLREAPGSLLGEARERTRGYPRALEHLFGILSADRDTSLQQILTDTRQLLPNQVVAVLVGEAFNRLDLNAQRAMQALAVYRYPVPPAAVDYLLQPYIPGVDSGRVLSRLVNMQFARRDAGRYYLHQVDRDYALTRIQDGTAEDRNQSEPPYTRVALLHRAAEWFKLSRKPREAWKSLGDLAPQLAEFELRCEGSDFTTAASLLLEFDFDFLFLWGHYGLMTELHERLQGRIGDPAMAQRSAGNLGSAHYRAGRLETAMTYYEQAIQLSVEHKDRWGEGVWVGNLGVCIADLGEHDRATELFEKALAIAREVGYRRGESQHLSNLATQHGYTGQLDRAIDLFQKALAIDREIHDQEAETIDLTELGRKYADAGRGAEAAQCYTDSLKIASSIGYRLMESATRAAIGILDFAEGRDTEAAGELEKAIEIADEIGSPQDQKQARTHLAVVRMWQGDLAGARKLADDARSFNVPLANCRAAAVAGVVALRQNDLAEARTAFREALDLSESLLRKTPLRYEALDTKALALCGMALCADATRAASARETYQAARAVISAPGIAHHELSLFEAIAKADTNGLLASVRPVVRGATQPRAVVN